MLFSYSFVSLCSRARLSVLCPTRQWPIPVLEIALMFFCFFLDPAHAHIYPSLVFCSLFCPLLLVVLSRSENRKERKTGARSPACTITLYQPVRPSCFHVLLLIPTLFSVQEIYAHMRHPLCSFWLSFVFPFSPFSFSFSLTVLPRLSSRVPRACIGGGACFVWSWDVVFKTAREL